MNRPSVRAFFTSGLEERVVASLVSFNGIVWHWWNRAKKRVTYLISRFAFVSIQWTLFFAFDSRSSSVLHIKRIYTTVFFLNSNSAYVINLKRKKLNEKSTIPNKVVSNIDKDCNNTETYFYGFFMFYLNKRWMFDLKILSGSRMYVPKYYFPIIQLVALFICYSFTLFRKVRVYRLQNRNLILIT